MSTALLLTAAGLFCVAGMIALAYACTWWDAQHGERLGDVFGDDS